jgi:ABC-type Na+ efflux pump permease subunit
MPSAIILLLVASPILSLCMLTGSGWSPEALAVARLALVVAVVVVVLWVVVDALQALRDRWRRFISRPYLR